LDALSPPTIRGILRSAIEEHIDWEVWRRSLADEESDQEMIGESVLKLAEMEWV
jgi:hypothetical protein